MPGYENLENIFDAIYSDSDEDQEIDHESANLNNTSSHPAKRSAVPEYQRKTHRTKKPFNDKSVALVEVLASSNESELRRSARVKIVKPELHLNAAKKFMLAKHGIMPFTLKMLQKVSIKRPNMTAFESNNFLLENLLNDYKRCSTVIKLRNNDPQIDIYDIISYLHLKLDSNLKTLIIDCSSNFSMFRLNNKNHERGAECIFNWTIQNVPSAYIFTKYLMSIRSREFELILINDLESLALSGEFTDAVTYELYKVCERFCFKRKNSLFIVQFREKKRIETKSEGFDESFIENCETIVSKPVEIDNSEIKFDLNKNNINYTCMLSTE